MRIRDAPAATVEVPTLGGLGLLLLGVLSASGVSGSREGAEGFEFPSLRLYIGLHAVRLRASGVSFLLTGPERG